MSQILNILEKQNVAIGYFKWKLIMNKKVWKIYYDMKSKLCLYINVNKYNTYEYMFELYTIISNSRKRLSRLSKM